MGEPCRIAPGTVVIHVKKSDSPILSLDQDVRRDQIAMDETTSVETMRGQRQFLYIFPLASQGGAIQRERAAFPEKEGKRGPASPQCKKKPPPQQTKFFFFPRRYGKRNMEASLGQGCSLLQSPEGFGVTEEIFERPQDTGRVIYLQIELPAVFSRRVMKAPRLRMIRAGLISQVAQNLSPQPFTPALRKDQEAPLAFFVRLVFSSERHGPHFFARALFPPWPRPSQRH